MNANVTNSACGKLAPGAFNACSGVMKTYDSTTGSLSDALLPIYCTLFVMGTLYLINGVVRIADHGVKAANAVTRKSDKKAKQTLQILDTESSDDSLALLPKVRKKGKSSCWKKTTRIWKATFKTGRTLSTAALCLFIAIPLLKFHNFLESSGSGDVSTSCTHFKAEAVDQCEWADQFLIAMVKELIHQISR